MDVRFSLTEVILRISAQHLDLHDSMHSHVFTCEDVGSKANLHAAFLRMRRI